MKVHLFVLTAFLMTACAHLSNTDSLNAENLRPGLAGVYVLADDSSSAEDSADLPLEMLGLPGEYDPFEVLFTEDNTLVLRSANQPKAQDVYFNGEFKSDGTYTYFKKETEGFPLINRSARSFQVTLRKSIETGQLHIACTHQSSALLFLFFANGTETTRFGIYNQVAEAPVD